MYFMKRHLMTKEERVAKNNFALTIFIAIFMGLGILVFAMQFYLDIKGIKTDTVNITSGEHGLNPTNYMLVSIPLFAFGIILVLIRFRETLLSNWKKFRRK